jgi:hypothetical protein
MNKKELEIRLIKEGIRADSYHLEGGLPNESFTLNKNGNQWEVYYSERGNKTDLRVFESEEEACEYLYKELTDCLKRMRLL